MRTFDYYEVTTPAASDPVLFAAAANWCRDIDATDTALVNSLIAAATDQIEMMTNRVFITRTYSGWFQNFKTSRYEPHCYLEVRKATLASVTSITINGTLVDSGDYIVKQKSGFSRILFPIPPTLLDDEAYPIEVEFIAGTAVESVPDGIITAIQQLVLFWYENRGDIGTDGNVGIPLVVKALVKQYRILATYG